MKNILFTVLVLTLASIVQPIQAAQPTQTDQQIIQQTEGIPPVPSAQVNTPDRMYNDANYKTYDLSSPAQAYYNTYPGANPYYTRQGYSSPPPAPIYGYGYYGSLPPPTPNQAFPDKAQSDALYNHLINR